MCVRKIATIFLFITIAAGCASKKNANKQSHHASKDAIVEFATIHGIRLNKQSNKELYALVADWYGVPHKDNGCEKTGTDCSCFVQMVYAKIYQINIGRSSSDMYKNTKRIDKHLLQEGDLVFFTTKGASVSHVGVYLNNDKFVHVSSSKGVAINGLNEAYYIKTFKGCGKRP